MIPLSALRVTLPPRIITRPSLSPLSPLMMDNQPTTVLQNTTNTYDGSTLHAFFQRHKRPSDDGMTEQLSKKPRIEVVTGSQEAEPQTLVEDVVEDEVRVPRTNTFKMLRNIHRARNVLAQPSSRWHLVFAQVAGRN